MADENQNNAEMSQSINGLKAAIQSLQKDMRSSSYTEMKDAVKEGVKEASEGDDIQRVSDLRALGYDEQDAQLRIAANTELVRLREQQEALKNLQEDLGGLGAKDSSVLEQLEFDIDRMLEIQKFGRTLGNFEKRFKGFLGGPFEELLKETEKGGKLTTEGIGREVFSNLRGDFDKITAFLGPAATALQNLPFVGTIANFLGAYVKKFFVWAVQTLFLQRKAKKDSDKQFKQQYNLDKKNAKRDDKKAIEARRKETMEKGLKPKADGSPDMRYKDAQESDEGGVGGIFAGAAAAAALGATASIFNPVTMGLFVAASVKAAAGLTILGGGIAAFLALVGVGVGAVIAATMTGMALGIASFKTTGATDALKELSSDDIDYGKVAGGLAMLSGASLLSSIAGLADLLTGGGLKQPFTNLGRDAGGFAREIRDSGFLELDLDGFAGKVAKLTGSTFLSGIAGLIDFFTGGSLTTPLTNLGKDASGFAKEVEPFMNMDIDAFETNMNRVTTAMGDFEMPEGTGFFEGVFGTDGISKLNELASIQFADDNLGGNLESVGEAIGIINANLDGLDTDKFSDFVNDIDDLKDVTLNFGAIPSAAGVGANFQSSASGEMTPVINQINAPQVQNTSNMRKTSVATGSGMKKHPALNILG